MPSSVTTGLFPTMRTTVKSRNAPPSQPEYDDDDNLSLLLELEEKKERNNHNPRRLSARRLWDSAVDYAVQQVTCFTSVSVPEDDIVELDVDSIRQTKGPVDIHRMDYPLKVLVVSSEAPSDFFAVAKLALVLAKAKEEAAAAAAGGNNTTTSNSTTSTTTTTTTMQSSLPSQDYSYHVTFAAPAVDPALLERCEQEVPGFSAIAFETVGMTSSNTIGRRRGGGGGRRNRKGNASSQTNTKDWALGYDLNRLADEQDGMFLPLVRLLEGDGLTTTSNIQRRNGTKRKKKKLDWDIIIPIHSVAPTVCDAVEAWWDMTSKKIPRPKRRLPSVLILSTLPYDAGLFAKYSERQQQQQQQQQQQIYNRNPSNLRKVSQTSSLLQQINESKEAQGNGGSTTSNSNVNSFFPKRSTEDGKDNNNNNNANESSILSSLWACSGLLDDKFDDEDDDLYYRATHGGGIYSSSSSLSGDGYGVVVDKVCDNRRARRDLPPIVPDGIFGYFRGRYPCMTPMAVLLVESSTSSTSSPTTATTSAPALIRTSSSSSKKKKKKGQEEEGEESSTMARILPSSLPPHVTAIRTLQHHHQHRSPSNNNGTQQQQQRQQQKDDQASLIYHDIFQLLERTIQEHRYKSEPSLWWTVSRSDTAKDNNNNNNK